MTPWYEGEARHMYLNQKFFGLSIAAAAAVWIFLSFSILSEVIESRKNTIAARPTGYIQEAIKEKLTSGEILASEPVIIPKVFGLMLLNTAVFWGVLWAGFLGVNFAVTKLKAVPGDR
jgi:hypothetical protein